MADETLTEKTCIICRKPKTEFNGEHVFPAAVGGAFVIDLVCVDCNTLLGKTIDTPFLNHKEILLARHQHQIRRDDRDIRNPFQGQSIKDENGNDVYVSVDENGRFEAVIKPDFQIIQTDKGPVGKLVLAGKHLNDEVLERYQKKFELLAKEKVMDRRTVESATQGSVRVTLTDASNKIIWECLKIGYETAVACLPVYFTDPLAVALSSMLHANEFDRSLQRFFNPTDLPDSIDRAIDQYPSLHQSHCFVILMNVPGRGLVSMVKVFSVNYAFILSKRTDYFDNRMLVVLNNSAERTFGCWILKRATTFTFGLNQEVVNGEGGPKDPFSDSNGLIPLFNEKGEKMLDHIEQVMIYGFANQRPEPLATVSSLKLSLTDGHFLRSMINGKLYKVVEVALNYQ